MFTVLCLLLIFLTVIDLGGVRNELSGTVNLDSLGLVLGRNYPIDVFFAERHTVLSNFKIETTLIAECNFYDWCGRKSPHNFSRLILHRSL